MHTILALLALTVIVLIVRFVWLCITAFLVWPLRDRNFLGNLPGPHGSIFQSHIQDFNPDGRSERTSNQWFEKFGHSYRFHGFGRFDYRLMTTDPRALSHILTSSHIYEKPWQTRKVLSRLLGRGISCREGEEHKIQRRIIGPAFTNTSVSKMIPIFISKAEELRDGWMDLFAQEPKVAVDVSHWTSRSTFEVIGLNFGLDFRKDEMYTAYKQIFSIIDKGPGLRELLFVHIPFFDTFWPDDINKSLKVIRRVGSRLIAERKAVILAEKGIGSDKDVLSLLIKSNLSSSQRLSDSDLLDQLSTFLFAGSDTTALSISWFLHSLAENPETQRRLRDEITTHAASANNNWDSLPYLDACTRESLRFSPPIHSSIRVAMADDRIPVSQPVPLRNQTGFTEESGYISIRKGSFVHIPIEGINLSKAIWGPDAGEFNPDRWLNLPASARTIDMTFSFGPSCCPAQKMSIVEIKTFIAVLLQSFAFEPAEKICKFNAIFTRPYVDDKFEEGAKLPLKISRI